MSSHRPPTRRAQPAAVSALVADVVHGPRLEAQVIGAHRFAVYLAVQGRVLPVITSDAVTLPTAVRLAVGSGAMPWGVEPGQVVTVGGGRVALPAFDVVAARTWRPARVRRTPARVGCPGGRQGSRPITQPEVDAALGQCVSTTGRGSGWLADGIRQARGAVGCPDGCPGSHPSSRPEAIEAIEAAVAGLVGRGAGLTPSGDDALAGALLVLHALGTGPELADAVRARLGATTAVSAALLDAAADGYAARPVVTLVDAAVEGDAGAVRRALPVVLAIGHTSGADTVTGIRAALTPGPVAAGCSGGRPGSHVSTHLEESAA